MVFRPAHVAVFVDGCFWHGCPQHYRPATRNAEFWDAKLAENRGRDQRVTLRLQEAGWTVLRFWEHETPESVARVIIETVQRERLG